MEATDTRMIGFHVPDDEKLLAAFGEVSIRHSHLDYILKMLIKSLSGISIQEARDATAYASSSELRDRIKKLARQVLGEGANLLKVQALMERCKRATEKRNALIHGVFAKELDGDPVVGTHDGTWEKLPTVEDVMELATELHRLTRDINAARLRGYLFEAMAKRPRGRVTSPLYPQGDQLKTSRKGRFDRG
jgi:hypothetical protein